MTLTVLGALLIGGSLYASSARNTGVRALLADAEEGQLSPWDDHEAAAATRESAHDGLYGYEVAATSEAGYLRWESAIEHDLPRFQVHTWVQLKSRADGESVDLITVQNDAGEHHFDFFVTPDLRFKWDLFSTHSRTSDIPVELDRWYLVEAEGSFGTDRYTVNVTIDGRSQGRLLSPGQKPSTVTSLWLGTANDKTHRQWYDDVSLEVGPD